jgi:2-desacetyl-2-hydroxyethyl bacteriochlorophyllide A dehydrogenase
MRKTIVFEEPRKIGFRELPEEPCGEGQVRVRTLYSGISRGTEMTNYRGQNAGFRKRWDPRFRLYRAGEATSKSFPLESEGYEEVGEVVEIGGGVSRFQVGERVCGVWGHWTEAVFDAEEVRVQKMPAGLDPIAGVFLPIAHVAFNGVLDGEINLGETVAVFGLGVVGQLVGQLCRLSGATVVGVDRVRWRLELGQRLGAADTVIDAAQGSPAERIKELTEGRGADVCFECTGVPEALNEAIRACAYSSKVIAMGLITAEGRGLFLGEEFHQNRVNVVCSQIFGTNPCLRHRWDHQRIQQTILQLMSGAQLKVKELISHSVPFEEAARAFEMLDTSPHETMEVVLAYRPSAGGGAA